jgi:hypothetical protein
MHKLTAVLAGYGWPRFGEMRVRWRSRVILACAIGVLIGVTCSESTGPGNPIASLMQAISTLSQQATAGSAVTDPPAVIVRDQANNPMSGVTVTFTVTGGGGTVLSGAVTTGSDGVARVASWTLGGAPGANTLTAATVGLPAVTFMAEGTPPPPVPTTVEALTPTNQNGIAGAPVNMPPGILVKDQYDAPMQGVTVAFAVTAGGGSANAPTVVTDAAGEARLTSWTLGGAAGVNTLTATVEGLAPVTFTATGLVATTSVAAHSVTEQQAPAGTDVAAPPAAIVTDQGGAPLAGIVVEFAVTAGGGSIDPSSVVTGPDGIAQLTSWTLGGEAGANAVSATVSGLPPVLFNATGTLVATTVTAVTPTSLQAPISSTVFPPPGVEVRDHLDRPMPGVSVTFAVTQGGGSVVPETVVTGANGQAHLTSWTVGPTAGANEVTATVAGLPPVLFAATGVEITPAPTTIEAVTPLSQSAAAGRAVAVAPGVRVLDQLARPMPGVTVTFTVTQGGGTVTPPAVVTGANGEAHADLWVLGPSPGGNSVSAAVSGLASVVFSANAFPAPAPATVSAVTVTTQQAAAGFAVDAPPGVVVRDEGDAPSVGVVVTFTVTSGGGAVSPTSVATDAAGEAHLTSWTLGVTPGTNTVTAAVSGLTPVTFSATGILVPANIEATTVQVQNADVGSPAPEPPAVLVRDQHMQPMAGASVTFAVTAGGGAVTPMVVTTNSSGIAQVTTWTMGPAAGENVLTATVSGLPPVTFTAHTGSAVPVATSIQAVTPTAQTSGAGMNIQPPPGVVVRDQNGGAMAGVNVSFTVTAGGGSVLPGIVTTGANGEAHVDQWTLGATPGSNTVSASVSGLQPVTFSATGTLIATTVEAASATNQSGEVNTDVADPPAVLVRDQNGAPLAGISVMFAVTAGGGSVSPTARTTGLDGIARVTRWTLGSSADQNVLTASVSGLTPVTFVASAGVVAPIATSISAFTPTAQSGGAGLPVSVPPGVVVRDQNDALMPGVSVTFAVTSGGGSVSPSVVVTDSNGEAQLTSWTLGAAPGSNTVTATVAGLSAVTFSATGGLVAATVAAVSSTDQTAPVGTAVSEPPAVIVRDQTNTPLQGVVVSFAITSGGGSRSPASVTSGADGMARLTSWTLGPAAGANTLTATVGSLSPVAFNANGYVPVASSMARMPGMPETQSAPGESPVPFPPGVIVHDQSNNPMAGVTVGFAVTAGTGTVTPTSVMTDSNGIAQVTSWTLSQQPATQSVTATLAPLPSVVFEATRVQTSPVATSLAATTQLLQTAPAGSAVSEPPGVIVRDQNSNPMANVSVSFTVTAGGGSRSPSSVATNSSGIAQLTNWILGTSPGTNTLIASVSGITETVTFTATGTLVPVSVSATSPTSQNAPAGATVASAPTVVVRDQNNDPLAGVTVQFAVTAGGGAIAPVPPNVITGGDGSAQLTSWTLGVTPGTNTVTATVSGLPAVNFNATGVLVPSTVAAVTTTALQAPAGSAVSPPPGVIVRDQFGNGLAGVGVTFTVTSGGGSVMPTSVSTAANGEAHLSSWTLGTAAGQNTVAASVNGSSITPVVFTATGTLIASTVTANTPVNQQAPAGSPVGTPPGVIVRDQNNAPLPGVTVQFAVTSGGGSVSPASVDTDANGVAQLTIWTLGATAGANSVTATVAGLPPVTFNATGLLVASSITALTATSFQAPAGSAVSPPPAVVVRDQNNTPMSGVTVTFAVTAGGGSAAPTSAATDSDGVASVTSWTLGAAAGTNTLTATVAELTPVTFTATGVLVATSLEAASVTSQQAPAGTAVSQPPAVLVRDQNGNPLAGTNVTFTVTAGGGSVNPTVVTTGSNGVAQPLSWTLGTAPGTNTVSVTAGELSPVTFNATGILVATTISATTATSQQAPAGSNITPPPGVIVRDHLNNPMAGVTVAFAVTGGGGSISPATVITDGGGNAQLTRWTLGLAAGTNTVTATVAGLTPVTFTATGVVVPAAVHGVTPLSQSALAGSAVPQPPGVVVHDQNGNPLQGVSVAFDITGGGGSRTPASVLTNSSGVAQLTNWILGSAPGVNTLTATVSGLTPVTFAATGTLAATSVQANTPTSQTAPAGSAVSQPPAVIVRDQQNNPLQGVTVIFAVTAGAGAVAPTSVVTAANGVAQLTSWTLGTAAGTNTVTATVSGLAAVTFNATATLTATSIQALTATSQQEKAGSPVPQPPGVVVRDQNNNLLAGTVVTFAVTAGGGAVTPTSVTTSSSGVAQATSWTLGIAAGANAVTATVAGLSPVTFNATALAATTMQPVTPTTQMGLAGVAVADPPGVVVRDDQTNPLSGIAVSFSVAGGGSISPASVTTGADGIARLTSWTLAAGTGNSVTASAAGLSNVVFSATVRTPTTIQAVTPLTQHGAVSTAVSHPPGVQVLDQTNAPLAGVTVSFAVTSGGGTRSPASAVTNSNGVAQLTSWVLGSSAGTNTLTATVSGLSPVTFTGNAQVLATSIEAVSATSQQAAAGTAVADPPGVIVRAGSSPLAGVSVTFQITSGSGSINPVAALTGGDGVARLSNWFVGSGTNTVTATVAGLTPVTFTATGLPPASIQATTPANQEAFAGGEVGQPPAVQVNGAGGVPLAGVNVQFAVTAGGGVISHTNRVTGSNGVAQLTSWTLGSTPGVNTVNASVSGLAPVTFSANGVAPPAGAAAAVEPASTTSQDGVAGRSVTFAPSVLVRDASSNPVAGVTVTFAVTGGGGSVSPATKVTGTDGVAGLSSWVLGTVPGVNTVTATVASLTPVTFTATGALIPVTIYYNSPINQLAAAGAPVPSGSRPSVGVIDQNGDPLPGITVSFSIGGGGGSVSSGSVVTDVNGIATVTSWTLGTVPGTNILNASIAGLPPLSFTAVGTLVPAIVVPTTPTSQQSRVGTAVASPPGVIVLDQNNNPLPNVNVIFQVTAGGGSVSPSGLLTGADGIAQANSWILGPAGGANTVTATVTGVTPVAFNATGLVPSTVTAVTQQTQTAPAGSAVQQSPGVIVRDQNGNPVPGVNVGFAVTAGGGTVSPGTVTTDADGIARSTQWTLGSAEGSNAAVATVSGLPTVTFTATATLIPGSIVAATSVGQQAPAGSTVTAAPGVIVRNQFGNPLAGVNVSFAVTAGGGVINPGVVTTGADGAAHLLSWKLGNAGGTNTVTATVPGLAPITFNATGLLVPTLVQAVSATSQKTAIGTDVIEPPAVIVRDQNSNPLSGVSVAFNVTAGGGFVVPSVILTDPTGVARLLQWRVGASPGLNTVTATVSGLSPIAFNATGMAPGSVLAVSPIVQGGVAGGAVAQPPSVLVRDTNNDPLRNVTVTFALTSGGGSISPTTRLSDANGLATLDHWLLGSEPGVNTVTATASGLSPVTFTANSESVACPDSPIDIALGATASNTLGSTGCRLASGEYVEFYRFSLASATTVRIVQSSGSFNSYVIVARNTGELVAENDDSPALSGLDSEARAFLQAGTYLVAATSSDVGEAGAFTLRVETTSSEVTNCWPYFTMRGNSHSQALSNTDCAAGNMWADFYVVYLQQGETLTLQMNSTQFDAYLMLMLPNGNTVENDNGGGGTNARIVHTAQQAGYYIVSATSARNNQTGAYTLSVQ